VSDEEFVRSFFTTLSSGDLDRVGAFFDAESTWTVCATEIPGAGMHRGRDEIIEAFLRPVRGMFAPGQPRVEITNLVAAAGWVAIEAIGRGEFLSGTPYENHYSFWLEVDRGTIRTIREYMDSHYVAMLAP
jgi:uncharacterized protein